jgi:hypothetical protein
VPPWCLLQQTQRAAPDQGPDGGSSDDLPSLLFFEDVILTGLPSAVQGVTGSVSEDFEYGVDPKMETKIHNVPDNV